MARINLTYNDHGGEKSSVGMNIDDLANATGIEAAIDAIASGVLNRRVYMTVNEIVSSLNATSPWAQVELGLRIHLQDAVADETGYITIPCPNLDALTLEGDTVVLADGGVMAALVTEIETHVLSRDENAVTVARAEIVGRNR